MVQKLLHNFLYYNKQKSSYNNFFKALENPSGKQNDILQRILRENKNTLFGEQYNFKSIKSIEDFQKLVPIFEYQDLYPWILKIKDIGTQNVLTKEPVLMFEKTSGSTGQGKFIPYTRSFLQEFHSGIAPWMYDLYKNNIAMFSGTTYWSISPKLEESSVSTGGIRIGFDSDLEYLPEGERNHLVKIMTKLNTEELNINFHKETALALLSDEKLTFISIWSPTFLIIILEYILKHKSELLFKLKEYPYCSKKQFFHLEKNLNNREIDFSIIFKSLKIISCWNDHTSKSFAKKLQSFLPKVKIQSKGLLLTEGIISIPLTEITDPILTINSHFYEFEDELTKEVLLFNQVVIGRIYIPIVTSSNGFYRYRTNDKILITGKFKGVPLLRFVGRTGRISDYFGEKIAEDNVKECFTIISNEFNLGDCFKLLAFCNVRKPYYAFFMDEQQLSSEEIIQIEKKLDDLLQSNHNYKKCLDLKQLHPVKLHIIENGNDLYQRYMTNVKKIAIGNIKPEILCLDADISQFFLD